MRNGLRRAAFVVIAHLALVAAGGVAVAMAFAAGEPPIPCTVDLTLPGMMKDNLSNVFTRSIKRPTADVDAFLDKALHQFVTGDELMRATAKHFGIDQAILAAEVERFRHINCKHPPVDDPRYMPPDSSRLSDQDGDELPAGEVETVELTAFARDVTLHVVLHELGHALIREFDLPILGNEETMADAFATHYVTTHMPDRAVDVLVARTTSLMIEAKEVERSEWPVSGEHDNDARRAFQIAALAIAADRAKFAPVADVVGMSDNDRKKATDYGAEIHRSWRRVLAPLRMPPGMTSTEARVVSDDSNGTFADEKNAGLPDELEAVLKGFDWHSSVTIHFATGEGGAAWNRSKRTITVHNEYLRRFVEQGKTKLPL
jgi:Putative metallopeptidase